MEDDKKMRKNKKKKNKQNKNNVVIRDHNLVNNDDKHEHANLTETADNSIVDRETGNGDHARQSVSEDWDCDCDWNWDAEIPNKDLNVDFNGYLPNGKKCVCFPSNPYRFSLYFSVIVFYAHDFKC